MVTLLNNIKNFFEKSRDEILDFFYPEDSCPLCSLSSVGLCDLCKKELHEYGKFKVDTFTGIAMYHYEGVAQELIYKSKKKLSWGAINAWKKLVIEYIDKNKELFLDYSFITYIPSSKKMIRERGFDFSYEMADTLSKHLSIPLKKYIKNLGHSEMKN